MKIKVFITCSALYLATACATNLSKLNKQDITGQSFNAYLAEGYKALANDGVTQRDRKYSEHIANKGLAALSGSPSMVTVTPDNPADFKINNKEELKELLQAHENLLKVIASNIHHKNARLKSLADAQVNFDCWIEEAKQQRKETLKVCKDKFYSSLRDSVFKDGGNLEIRTMKDGYIVYFQHKHADLNNVDHDNLHRITDLLNADPSAYITVDGFTDRANNAKYNHQLSLKRAHVVAKYLQAHGLKKQKVKVRAIEKEVRAINNRDVLKDMQNRRVEIRTHKQ